MSYFASKLKHRIQILQGTNTPNDYGGFDRGYKKLITLWAWKKPFDRYGFVKAIRSVNTENIDLDTDEFGVRFDSVVGKFYRAFGDGFGEGSESYKSDGMGKQFDLGFDNGFDSMVDMYPVKADYFIFLQAGDAYRGRLYKINRVVRDDNYKEMVLLRCCEIEEQGLGATE